MFTTREYTSNPPRYITRMDPDCAICHAPATAACDCEARGLEVAVKQAESRMMTSLYNDIRTWVREHAQDYILEYFRLLTERRKTAHSQHMERLSQHSYHYYHAPPHPNEITQAQAALKRGIDEDWQASVQRYPEVLEYFYSLVELTLPSDDDATVKDPPLSALNGSRKAGRRQNSAPTLVGETFYDARNPPPIHRRTPGPPMGGFGVPPPILGRRSQRPMYPPSGPPTSFYSGGPY